MRVHRGVVAVYVAIAALFSTALFSIDAAGETTVDTGSSSSSGSSASSSSGASSSGASSGPCAGSNSSSSSSSSGSGQDTCATISHLVPFEGIFKVIGGKGPPGATLEIDRTNMSAVYRFKRDGKNLSIKLQLGPSTWRSKPPGAKSPEVTLCRPCQSNADCKFKGVSSYTCLRYGDIGNFCGRPCNFDYNCPAAYHCGLIADLSGKEAKRCVRIPDNALVANFGQCPCSLAFVQVGAKTTCKVNVPGSAGLKCTGMRTCQHGGLTACSAPAPKTEVCDGLDNDCDGATDEPPCGK